MEKILERAIIVGPSELHNFFTSYYDTWDTQVPTDKVADVWVGLNNGTLSPESNVVVFTDADFENFEEYAGVVEAIATFASEAIVLVIFYDTNNYDRLQTDVTQKQSDLNLPAYPFFPIDAQSNVGEEISKAFEYYAQNIATAVVPDAEPVQEYAAEPAQPDSFSHDVGQGKKRGVIVVSTSSKGGSGKTTVGMLTGGMIRLASQTAVDQGLREKPLSVVLVDMDIRDGQIGFIIRQLTPTALNIFLLPEKTKEVIQDNLVYDDDLQVHALLAPKRAANADFLSPEFYVHIIDQLAEMYDVVVLDTSVDYTDVLLSKVVLPMSDAIMFVSNLSVGSVYGMNRWLDEVTTPTSDGGPGISKSKIGIVINQAMPNLIDMGIVREAADGTEILVTIPMDTSGLVTSATNSNKMSNILKFSQEISPAYFSIIKQLLPHEVFADPLIVSESADLNSSATLQQDSKKPKRKRGLFG